MQTIEEVCETAFVSNAQDVFLKSGIAPRVRIDNDLREMGQVLSHAEMQTFWERCGASEDGSGEKDTGWITQTEKRFRVNCFKSMGELCAVLRPLRPINKTLVELGLPEEKLQQWLARRTGLILVTGPTNSGKSTTLSSALKWLADHKARHIVTIEDPIEFIIESEAALVSQRQVGADTQSFDSGLRAALRQSPDVIMVGEIRDYETAKSVLLACETGHLVVATLHSADVIETTERLVSLIPPEERETSLAILSKQLIGILSQQLVPKVDGGLCLLLEYLEISGAVRKWIKEGELLKIGNFLHSGQSKNLRFIDSIHHYHKHGVIDTEVAQEACGDPEEFDRLMMGVGSGSR